MQKRHWYVLGVIAGLIIAIVGLVFLRNDGNRALAAVLIGVGAGLFGMAGGEWIAAIVKEKNPALTRQVQIEGADERNVHIDNLAKGKAFNTMGWLYPAFILIMVLAGVDLWLTLLLIAGYAAQWALYIIHLTLLNKKM